MTTRTIRSHLFVLFLAIPAVAVAQPGRISGTITESGGAPVVGAQLLVPALALSALSTDGGRFNILGVPAGTYDVRVLRVGYKATSQAGVSVTAGGDANISVTMEPADVHLQTVVVTASRHAEKITDAAASITPINPRVLDDLTGNSYFLALKSAPGLDVTQVGITSVFVNGRGFNNRYNTRWLTLEDGRVAVLAEQGLPIGEHTTIPKLDVGTIEVLNGPSSALYGSNASNGLMSIQTKDPRRYPGLSVDVSGGSRNLLDVQARYAGTRGKWGYKISGEKLSADDFSNVVHYPAVTAGGPTLPETITDWRTDVSRTSGALVYYLGDASKVQFNSGYSIRNGVGDSNSGHYQIKDWTYSNHQLLFSNPRWFAQAYITHGNSGNTNQIYANVPLAARNPQLSADSIWELTRFHVDGRIYAAEVQNNFLAGSLASTGISALDNSLITWGVQVRRTRNSSYQTVLIDKVTGKAIETSQQGFYGQLETPLAASWRTVVSGRYDAVSRYDGQFSPRASLLYSPKPDQTIRVTYGEAYRTPPILNTDAYGVPNATTRNIGNQQGFIIKDAAGNVVSNVSGLVPETNKTWEVGYKAVVGQRLFVDVTGWHSTFVDFISGGLVIADPFTGQKLRAYDPVTDELWADPAGNPVKVQTNFNLGEAIARGVDIAARFYFTDHFALASVMNFASLDTVKVKPTDPKDAGLFNTSSSRLTFSFESSDLPRNVDATATVRYVNGYQFRSAVVWGEVPMYASLDLSASWRLPRSATKITLAGQNLAGCVGGIATQPVTGLSSSSKYTFEPGRKCGLGQKHSELLDMPLLGPTVILGVRREWR